MVTLSRVVVLRYLRRGTYDALKVPAKVIVEVTVLVPCWARSPNESGMYLYLYKLQYCCAATMYYLLCTIWKGEILSPVFRGLSIIGTTIACRLDGLTLALIMSFTASGLVGRYSVVVVVGTNLCKDKVLTSRTNSLGPILRSDAVAFYLV